MALQDWSVPLGPPPCACCESAILREYKATFTDITDESFSDPCTSHAHTYRYQEMRASQSHAQAVHNKRALPV